MRVAMLTFYPEDPARVSGGVRMVSVNLAEALRRYADLDLHVIHCHSDIVVANPETPDRVVTAPSASGEGRLTVAYLPLPRRSIAPNLTMAVSRLKRYLRALQPDLVHAHVGHFAYVGVSMGLPTIYTIHGVLSRERQVYSRRLYDRLRYGLLSYYEARALPRVQQLVAISTHVQAEYGQIRSVPWARIDNPAPQAFFDLTSRPESGRILYAGSITEIKDLFTLMRAIERVRVMRPDVALYIAGRVTSEAYAERLRAFITERGLRSAVHFLGLLDRESLLAEYERCSVVVLTSVQENAPMTVIEAMASGVPVAATRVGGVPDLVSEGETGFMTAPGDDAALAERLLALLNDPDLRARLGRRAREVARTRFSAEQVASAYYALYYQVLARSRGDDLGVAP